jgi:hypothetical protein
LQPGDTATYSFVTSFVSPTNNYSLCAWTALTGDTYTMNDKLCKNVPTKPAALDAGVYRIVFPSSDTTYFGSASYPVTVMIRNFGTAAVSNFALELKVNGISHDIDTFTATLAGGDSASHTFGKNYNSPLGFYSLCAKTLLVGDADPLNDESCDNYFGMVGLNEPDGSVIWLSQNRPNPATGATIIEYSLPRTGTLVFELHNLLGRVIYAETIKADAGLHELNLDLHNIPAGVYVYGIRFEGYHLSKQMIVVK